MRQKVHNNAMLDLLTPTEFSHGIDSLIKKLSYNARFVRSLSTLDALSGQNQSSPTGVFNTVIGPPEGFLWSVMKLTVDTGGAGKWQGYVNNVTPANIVTATVDPTVSPTVEFGKAQLLLHSSDKLIIANAGAGAPSYPVAVMVHAIEVPNHHEAQLLV